MTTAPATLMAAEFGIRQLHARCADAVWRKDASAFADCFAEHGVWKVAGLRLAGREAVAEGFAGLTAMNQRILMRFATPIVSIDAEGVSARTHVVEHVKRNDGSGMTSIGIYFERFVEVGGAWQFTWRHFDFCYFGPPDLSAELYAFVDRGPPPGLPDADAATAGMQAP
ncbi:MAG: nuclear transport factor 2 family protein [Novosphingobium sp.]